MKLLADIKDVFGTITPPSPIAKLSGGDPTGATGISTFLSNLVTLIYIISVIVLLFMLLWGAFDWIVSEGDKEKLSNAQKKIINAFVGIIILAVAFAILQVLGTFTGFTFFEGQNVTFNKNPDGSIYSVTCPDGVKVGPSDVAKDYKTACKNHGL